MSKVDWTDEKILSRLLKNKTEKSRWDNILILSNRPSKKLFLKCTALTKSNNPKHRTIGIDILAQMGVPMKPFLEQTVHLYFELLNIETDPNVLSSLLFGIGKNNYELSQEQIEKICLLQNHDNDCVKEGLVSALGFIDHVRVIDVLIKLSEDKLSHVRDWATFYISQGRRNTFKIREALWKRVNDKHQDTKLEAILGLTKRKDIRVDEIIKRELLHGEYGSLLFEAISETKNTQFLPLLQQNLEATNGDNTINLEWKKDLEDCIEKLMNVTKNKTTNE